MRLPQIFAEQKQMGGFQIANLPAADQTFFVWTA